MAVREGDPLSTGHACTGISNLATSLVITVQANGIAGAVQGTPTVAHAAPPTPICPAHVAALNQGSTNVKIGGLPWGRVSDSADLGSMISGSLNVKVNGR